MPYHFLAILGVLAVGVLFVVLPVVLMTLSEHREQRFVLCPETGRPAGVHIKAGAAARGAIFGRVQLSVGKCSLWPERLGCAQACLQPSVEKPVPLTSETESAAKADQAPGV